MPKSEKDLVKSEECLKQKKKFRVKAKSVLKISALLFTTTTVCILLLLSIVLAVGLYWSHMDVRRLEDEAKRIDKQLADKEAWLNFTKRELEGKTALLKEKERELSSTKGALNLTSQRETSLDEQFTRLQRENNDLSQRLNNTLLERDQYAFQARNFSMEYRIWEQRYNSLLSQYSQERNKTEVERFRCEELGVEISPPYPRVSDDFTLRFSYGDGSPASGLPVYVRGEYESSVVSTTRNRFFLTDKDGKASIRGEEPSYNGSGWITIVLNCEKNTYSSGFYLYGNTQDIWKQTYGIEKINYTLYSQ